MRRTTIWWLIALALVIAVVITVQFVKFPISQ